MRVRKITKTWMLLVGTVVLCLTGCGKETQTADFSGVTSVCELATLKCYYHNVAKAETESSGIFAKWLKTGYKKIWTEYSGIIEYGIDISQVTVSEPDKNGVVTVTMPDAQVLNVDVDEDSLGTPLTVLPQKRKQRHWRVRRKRWSSRQKKIQRCCRRQRHGRRR